MLVTVTTNQGMGCDLVKFHWIVIFMDGQAWNSIREGIGAALPARDDVGTILLASGTSLRNWIYLTGLHLLWDAINLVIIFMNIVISRKRLFNWNRRRKIIQVKFYSLHTAVLLLECIRPCSLNPYCNADFFVDKIRRQL